MVGFEKSFGSLENGMGNAERLLQAYISVPLVLNLKNTGYVAKADMI